MQKTPLKIFSSKKIENKNVRGTVQAAGGLTDKGRWGDFLWLLAIQKIPSLCGFATIDVYMWKVITRNPKSLQKRYGFIYERLEQPNINTLQIDENCYFRLDLLNQHAKAH